jgi:hypothetical protein
MITSLGSGGVIGLEYFDRSAAEKEDMVCAKTREKCMSSEPCLGWYRGHRFVCPLCFRDVGANLKWAERRVQGMWMLCAIEEDELTMAKGAERGVRGQGGR